MKDDLKKREEEEKDDLQKIEDDLKDNLKINLNWL